MALLKRDTPEEAAAKDQRTREQAAAKAEEKRSKAFEKAWNAFWASPAGQARAAYRAGDHVFQYSIDVMNQQAIIVAMVGSKTASTTADPTAVLNAVSRLQAVRSQPRRRERRGVEPAPYVARCGRVSVLKITLSDRPAARGGGRL